MQMETKGEDASAVPGEGLEPPHTVSETAVLPLDEPGIIVARAEGFEPPFCGSKPRGLPLADTRMRERVERFELSRAAWKAAVLPLHHTRVMVLPEGLEPSSNDLKGRCSAY